MARTTRRDHNFLSQGDIFKHVPLAYPFPPGQIVEDPAAPSGTRHFLSGPFEVGHAMLITPTCSMRAQGTAVGSYAHPVRVLAVVRSVQELIDRGLLTNDRLGLLRKYDGLINYMYLPESAGLELSESVALLYMTVILHHDMIAGQRVTQLTYEVRSNCNANWYCSPPVCRSIETSSSRRWINYFDSLLTPYGANIGELSRTVTDDALAFSPYPTAFFPYFCNHIRRHQAHSHTRGQGPSLSPPQTSPHPRIPRFFLNRISEHHPGGSLHATPRSQLAPRVRNSGARPRKMRRALAFDRLAAKNRL